MAEKVLLVCISPKVGQLRDAYACFKLALERYHEHWFNRQFCSLIGELNKQHKVIALQTEQDK